MNNNEQPKLIQPNYSQPLPEDLACPSEDDDDLEDADDIREELENEKIMTEQPWSRPGTPVWGTTTPSYYTTPPVHSSPFSSPHTVNPWLSSTRPSTFGGYGTGIGYNGTTSYTQGQPFGNGYGNLVPAQVMNFHVQQNHQIPRDKSIIIVDLLDGLIETLSSGGKPGFLPRGIYDIRLRFEVWDRITCFGSGIKIGVLVPKVLVNTAGGDGPWRAFTNYIVHSLSEYLRIPAENVFLIIQEGLGQSKAGVLGYFLSQLGVMKSKDILYIGLRSGNFGQAIEDKKAAEDLGLDYIDLTTLITQYY